MCGRTRVSSAPERIEQATGAQRWQDRERYRPSHNIAPGTFTPVLRLEGGQPILHSMKWGLVPSFIKPGTPPDFFKMFNARSETLDSKTSFNRLLPSKRCVVLVDGFYEWRTLTSSKKQPYHVSLGKGNLMKFAGLFDVWKGAEDGEPLYTYTIVTCDSSPRLAWLHDRMPVMLTDDAAVAAWLGCPASSVATSSGKAAAASCSSQPQPEQQLKAVPEPQQEPETALEQPEPEAQSETALEQSGGGSGSSSQPEGGNGQEGKASVWFLLNQVCKPCNSEALVWHPVTPEMSSPSYQKPDASTDLRTKKGTISSFFKPSPKKVLNTDDQQGPTAVDEAAARAATAAGDPAKLRRVAGGHQESRKKAKTA